MPVRVVITGLGCVSGPGVGISDFWSALVNGHSAIAPLTGIGDDLKIRIGAIARGYRPEDHYSAEDLTLLDRFSQFAVLAAREAVDDAGLVHGESRIQRAAAIIGTGCGGNRLFNYQRLCLRGACHLPRLPHDTVWYGGSRTGGWY